MQIPENILEKWKALRSSGDNKKIAELGKVSLVTVSTAFNKGECSEELLEVMGKFYNKKISKLKKYA